MYRVETDEQAQQQIDQLPAHALAAYAELRILLEVGPWSGEPLNQTNPDAEVRTLTFGAHHEGMVTYLILDDQRRVDVPACSGWAEHRERADAKACGVPEDGLRR